MDVTTMMVVADTIHTINWTNGCVFIAVSKLPRVNMFGRCPCTVKHPNHILFLMSKPCLNFPISGPPRLDRAITSSQTKPPPHPS